MNIKIKFSGMFQIIAGMEQDFLNIPEGTTIDQLSVILSQRFQKLPVKSDQTYFVINSVIATRDQVIEDGDNIQIFQLFAGG